MNIQAFNDGFPSWEKQYFSLQKKVKKEEKQSRIIQFSKEYPTVNFTDLIQQNGTSMTDDGCIHYKNKITKEIYSWNFIKNKWEQHNKSYQNGLLKLFTD